MMIVELMTAMHTTDLIAHILEIHLATAKETTTASLLNVDMVVHNAHRIRTVVGMPDKSRMNKEMSG
jgi:hypothetical protein